MGGAAHRDSKVRKLTSNERETCIGYLQRKLNENQVFELITSPAPAPEKQVHGDIDLLVILKEDKTSLDMEKAIESAGLHSKLQHSYLMSIENDDKNALVQVDIIPVTRELLPVHELLLGYGDLGMVVGMCAKILNFTLNAKQGLRYACYANQKKIFFPISTSAQDICEKYLNLNYDRWLSGFKSEEEAFEWVCSMRPPLINEALVGKEKRAMFKRFSDWNNKRIENLSDAEKDEEMAWRKDQAKASLIRSGLWSDIQTLLMIETKAELHRQEFKKVFNGAVVQNMIQKYYPDLTLKYQKQELGNLMKYIRDELPVAPDLPSQDDIFRSLSRYITSEF